MPVFCTLSNTRPSTAAGNVEAKKNASYKDVSPNKLTMEHVPEWLKDNKIDGMMIKNTPDRDLDFSLTRARIMEERSTKQEVDQTVKFLKDTGRMDLLKAAQARFEKQKLEMPVLAAVKACSMAARLLKNDTKNVKAQSITKDDARAYNEKNPEWVAELSGMSRQDKETTLAFGRMRESARIEGGMDTIKKMNPDKFKTMIESNMNKVETFRATRRAQNITQGIGR